jgi:chlorite dismutase
MTNETTAPAANHVFFMLVKTTPDWLALNPTERFAFLGEVIGPILERNAAVRMRFFDSEAFASRYSDVVMWETADVLAYQAVVEELRETKFWDYYFSVVEIVPSIENGYARHYDVEPIGL